MVPKLNLIGVSILCCLLASTQKQARVDFKRLAGEFFQVIASLFQASKDPMWVFKERKWAC